MVLNEKMLVIQLKNGNSKAFEKLFFHYFPRFTRLSIRLQEMDKRQRISSRMFLLPFGTIKRRLMKTVHLAVSFSK
jgi:hypothetical protein